MRRMLRVGLGACLLLGLAACTAPASALDEAVRCLEDQGIEVEVRDGVIVTTQYANDDNETVPREVLDQCIPEELRG